jgi:membrane-associated protease RseP (regulator of RpoE activity)
MKKVTSLLLAGIALSIFAVGLSIANQEAKDTPVSYWVGLRLAPVPDTLLPQFGIDGKDTRSLAVVEQVVPKSPAEKAGLQRGDVLLKFGNKEISTLTDLVESVAAVKDTEQTLTFVRNGKTMDVKIKPEAKPAELLDAQQQQAFLEMPLGQHFQQNFQQGFPQGFRHFQQMLPPAGMNLGKEFFLGLRDPQEMLKEMEEHFEHFRQMPNADKLTDSSSKRLEMSSITDKDGKTRIQVKQCVQENGKTEEKQWEADSIETLPDEIRGEVQKIFVR